MAKRIVSDLRPSTEVDFEAVAQGQARGDFLLFNVLPAQAFEQVHIPGSISVPLSAIDESLPARFPDKTRPIVVYCKDSQ